VSTTKDWRDNTMPTQTHAADIPAILRAFSHTANTFVVVNPRTVANANLEAAPPNQPLPVWRSDLRDFGVHPNTGMPGDRWVPVGKIRYAGGGVTDADLTFSSAQGEVGLTAVAPNIPINGGRARVFFNGSVQGDTVGQLVRLLVHVSGVGNVGSGDIRIDATGGPGRVTNSFYGEIDLAPGSYTFDLRGRILSGGGNATVSAGARFSIDDIFI